MRLLPLSNDFVFKSIFAKNEDLLLDLLNSFPEFSGKKQIRNLQVMNPELPKSFKDDKLSILDIRAEDISGNLLDRRSGNSHRRTAQAGKTSS